MRTPEVFQGLSGKLAGASLGVIAMVSVSPEVASAQDQLVPEDGVDCIAPGLEPVVQDGVVYGNVSSLPDGATYRMVVGALPAGVSAAEAQTAFDARDYAVGFDQAVVGDETNEAGDCIAAPLEAQAKCNDLQVDYTFDGEPVDDAVKDGIIEEAEAHSVGREGHVVAAALLPYQAEVCEGKGGEKTPNGSDGGNDEPKQSLRERLADTGFDLRYLAMPAIALVGAGIAVRTLNKKPT